MTNKALIFDMDGTLNLFYDVENWLNDLEEEKTRPYEECKPKIDIDTLNLICELYRMIGYQIVVTSWLSKNATKEYSNRIRKAKIDWLKKVGFNYDEIHLVKYGTPKAKCTKKYCGNQILVDDNKKVRESFEKSSNKQTIDANKDIIKELLDLFIKLENS